MKNILNKIILKIKWLFRKNKIVPDISDKRKIIERYRELFRPKVLVETGTYFVDRIEAFKNKFEQVISIELSNELAEKALKRFEKDKNVTILQGDSSVVLSDLL